MLPQTDHLTMARISSILEPAGVSIGQTAKDLSDINDITFTPLEIRMSTILLCHMS